MGINSIVIGIVIIIDDGSNGGIDDSLVVNGISSLIVLEGESVMFDVSLSNVSIIVIIVILILVGGSVIVGIDFISSEVIIIY